MKAHDEIRLSTLRMLASALNYEFIAKQHKLNGEEESVAVRKEAKKRKDAIEAYTKAKAKDRAEREAKELKILEEFLPAQMADADLEALVDKAINEVGAKTAADMGRVIGLVMGQAKGKAEGAKVSMLVKAKLQ
jgi:uncharacterized protein YqeY